MSNKIKQLEKKIEEIDSIYGESFETFVKNTLLDAEERSYAPYEEKGKTELQMDAMETIVDDFFNRKIHLMYEVQRLREEVLALKAKKHTTLQFIKYEGDCFNEYDEFEEFKLIKSIKLDIYKTGDIVVTKISRRIKNDGYINIGVIKGEEGLQSINKKLKAKGYEVINFI